MKIFISGACGNCGTALVDLPYKTIFFDSRDRVESLNGKNFVKGNLSDKNLLRKKMNGCKALIHLAASSDPQSPWDDVLSNNIEGTYNIFYTALEVGISKIIFASSNHVVGMYEIENAPQIYEIGHSIMLDKNVAPRPDSYYGVSKLFGEQLGRYLAENNDLIFLSLRIGSVRSEQEDHPYAYAEAGVKDGLWEADSPQYRLQKKRLKAIWQSRRDFANMIQLCLQFTGSKHDIFYSVSNNERRWMDIDHARNALGYVPMDNSEDWNPSMVTG